MSDIKDLQASLKSVNQHQQMVIDQFNEFVKATKHGLLTLAGSIQDLADLEKEMKNDKKTAEQRNDLLKKGLNEAVKTFLDESKKVRKCDTLSYYVASHFKEWDKLDDEIKDIKIKKAE
jgi:hypothetical protein